MRQNQQDAIVIGGGFYGAVIAVYLARSRGFKHITLIEREPALLRRASLHNQARVHGGHHYPRSFTTAYRSQVNMPLFIRAWPAAIRKDFTALYAIARHQSKVTARQFERFCLSIGAPAQRADLALKGLFEPRLIEDVFLVEEYAFDYRALASWAQTELHRLGVQVCFQSCATRVARRPDGFLQVDIRHDNGTQACVSGRYIFNCTYSGLNQLQGTHCSVQSGLRHAISEIVLVRLPPVLQGLGITVMDGPFFSAMPFPANNLHSLTHVRYTPHTCWDDDRSIDPYRRLEDYPGPSRAERMIKDAGRYLPAIREAQPVMSLFEVKTVLASSRYNDARPILFEQDSGLPGCYAILGGKLDNIHDVLKRLDAERLEPVPVEEGCP